MAPMLSKTSRFSALTLFLILATCALLILSRAPTIIMHGRFWAEEGKVFVANAATMPAWQALWNSYGGYTNLIANGAALAAWHFMPLVYAPYLTISIGLMFQLLPLFLILTSHDEWLRPLFVRLLAVLLVVFTPSSTEIWLQTLHCQFELALSCALILSFDTVEGPLGFFRLLILWLAPLAGPGSIVFFPLFCIRFLLEHSRQRLFQCAAIGTGAALQLGLFYVSLGSRGSDHWIGPALAAVFCREPLQLFLGIYGRSQALIASVHNQIQLYPARLHLAEIGTIIFFLPFAVLGILYKRYRAGLWLLLGNAAFTGAALFGSIGGALSQVDAFFGERYIYVGQALCSLMLLSFAAQSRKWPPRVAGYLAIAWILYVASTSFWNPIYDAHWPDWRVQVQLWQADHTHKLLIWPSPWFMELP